MPYFLFDPEAIKAANDAQSVLNADVTQENREKFFEAWRRLRNPYFEAALARFKTWDTTTLEVLVTLLGRGSHLPRLRLHQGIHPSKV